MSERSDTPNTARMAATSKAVKSNNVDDVESKPKTDENVFLFVPVGDDDLGTMMIMA